MRLGQFGEALEMEIELWRVRRHDGGAAALLAMTPVDPGASETGALGRDMVVMQALGRMQDLGFANGQVRFEMLEQISEIAGVGLVGADILGRVDGIEGDAELLVAGGEAHAIDI